VPPRHARPQPPRRLLRIVAVAAAVTVAATGSARGVPQVLSLQSAVVGAGGAGGAAAREVAPMAGAGRALLPAQQDGRLPPATWRLRAASVVAHGRGGPASGPVVPLASVLIPSVPIPPQVLGAYLRAARAEVALAPNCHLTWPILAGIGLVESGHAQGRGPGTAGWNGTARPAILGPLLDGTAFPAVPDSDHGLLDGSTTYDRAVGPMQFLPSTWLRWGRDANGDGSADPQDITDAATAAAAYLCAGGGDLRRPTDLMAAVFSYNHSLDYLHEVLSAASAYAQDPGGPIVMALAQTPLSAQPVPASAAPQAVPVAAAAPGRPPVSTTRVIAALRGGPAAAPVAATPAPAGPPPPSSQEPPRPSQPPPASQPPAGPRPTATATVSPTPAATPPAGPSPAGSPSPSPSPSSAASASPTATRPAAPAPGGTASP